jgi:hypothetical protein
VEEGLAFVVKFKTRAGGQGGVVVAGTSLGPTRANEPGGVGEGKRDAWWATDGWGAVGWRYLGQTEGGLVVSGSSGTRMRPKKGVLDGTTSVSA